MISRFANPDRQESNLRGRVRSGVLMAMRNTPGRPKGFPKDYSHGWHIHLVCNKFLDLEKMRPIASREGVGRIDFQNVTKEGARYLGKYLHKHRPGPNKGIPLWVAVGLIDAHRVKDIAVESTRTCAYHTLANAIHWFTTLRWTARTQMVSWLMFGIDIPKVCQIKPPLDKLKTSEEAAAWEELCAWIDSGGK
jgi:hypothetical protein